MNKEVMPKININKIGQLNDWVEGGIERFCGSCNWSCCNFDCVDTHPIDKDRWCHKFNKSVWTLEDANKCEEYFD